MKVVKEGCVAAAVFPAFLECPFLLQVPPPSVVDLSLSYDTSCEIAFHLILVWKTLTFEENSLHGGLVLYVVGTRLDLLVSSPLIHMSTPIENYALRHSSRPCCCS